MRVVTLLYPSFYICALLFLHKQILIALTLIIQVKICVVINDLLTQGTAFTTNYDRWTSWIGSSSEVVHVWCNIVTSSL